MAHVRTQIRDAVVSALTGLSQTGDNVFSSHKFPMSKKNLPGICVYTGDESSEVISITATGTKLQRILEISAEVYIKEVTNIDEEVDDISVEIEKAIDSDGTLSGLTKSIFPSEFGLELDKEAEKPVAVATLRFNAVYEIIKSNPELAV